MLQVLLFLLGLVETYAGLQVAIEQADLYNRQNLHATRPNQGWIMGKSSKRGSECLRHCCLTLSPLSPLSPPPPPPPPPPLPLQRMTLAQVLPH